MGNSEETDGLLHHLVNLIKVCTTYFDCITKMAREPVNQISSRPELALKARPMLKPEKEAHVYPVS